MSVPGFSSFIIQMNISKGMDLKMKILNFQFVDP